MSAKKLSNRELWAKAKESNCTAIKTITVKVPEIAEGMEIECHPLRSKDLHAMFDESLVSELDRQWYMIVKCYREDDGELLFSMDDIPMLEKLGSKFQIRLYDPAFSMSGLSGDDDLVEKPD